jgi:DNA-binding PadR family transcriptional regulator
MRQHDLGLAPEFLPLRPVEFYILLALSEGETHGYGIVRATEERSGSDVRLDTGTLYRALFRLREAGLVEETDRRAADDLGGRRRRYYRLTPRGRTVAVAEARRLAGLVRDATLAKLLGDPETV